MRRSLLWALLLIALVIVILLYNNSGTISLSLIFTTVRLSQPMALLAFTALGVLIGILLR